MRVAPASTEAAGIWTIQSSTFPENTASLALHNSAGFRVVGTRDRIARHHGRWRDAILIGAGGRYWDRTSDLLGVNERQEGQ